MEPRMAAEYALYMVAISDVKWLQRLMNRAFSSEVAFRFAVQENGSKKNAAGPGGRGVETA
ncbi:hypothetical protein UP10_12640 [Bradyrhizobium sp. LTSPM299]|nr:hypothetical protein UP10_12640 [Bradyrhizobium sp. LTSPM299]